MSSHSSSYPSSRATLPASTYFEGDEEFDDSDSDAAEVEATLNTIENQFNHAEDSLAQWSRNPATYTPLYLLRQPSLSIISERTENPSRPTSQSFSATRPPNPTPDALRRSTQSAGSPSLHSRASTDPVNRPASRRAGELIAFFEDKSAVVGHDVATGHLRVASAPGTGLSSSSAPQLAHVGATGAQISRPSSPTRSRSSVSSSNSASVSISSLLSPPALRALTAVSGETKGYTTDTGRSFTSGYTSDMDTRGYSSDTRGYTTDTRTFTGTDTRTFTATDTRDYGTRSDSRSLTYNTEGRTSTTGGYTSATDTFTDMNTSYTPAPMPVASSLRRTAPLSARSPITSVRNIVAAWKEKTPTAKSIGSVGSEASAGAGDGAGRMLSIRRRSAKNGSRRSDKSSTATRSTGGPSEVGFDVDDLKEYAKGNREPIRIGFLWYLNVHALPPYRWQRCQALLYPNMIVLSWIAPGGGRGVVTLDLLNCNEVRSVPSPGHPSAREDIGTIAALDMDSQEGGTRLMEVLCPFQLLYADGVERLAAESARERVRWVSAIWEALDRSVTLDDRSITRSPTGSIRTIRSIDSASSARSGSGSASTVFVPPLESIPDLSDLRSLSGTSDVTRPHTRAATTTDDTTYLYPPYMGDARAILPSRSDSLRKSTSLDDLQGEYKRKRPTSLSSGSGSDAAFFSAGSGERSSFHSLTSLTSEKSRTRTGPTTTVTETLTNTETFTPTRTRTFTGTESFLTSVGTYTEPGSIDIGSDTFVASASTVSRPRSMSTGARTDSDTTYSSASSSARLTNGSPYSGSRSMTYTGTASGASDTVSASMTSSRRSEDTLTGLTASMEPSTLLSTSTVSYGSTPSATSYELSASFSTLRDPRERPASSASYSTTESSVSGSTVSGSSLSRTREVRRRTARPRSRSFSTSAGVASSETQLTPSGSETGASLETYAPESGSAYDVCETSSLSGLTTPSWTSTTSSGTPIPPSSSVSAVSRTPSELYVSASSGSEGYLTPKAPSSVSSYHSAPLMPSDSEYDTADDYAKVQRPVSEAASSYRTAEVCPSEPDTIPSELLTPHPPPTELEPEADVSIRTTPVMSASSEMELDDVVLIPLPPSTVASSASPSVSLPAQSPSGSPVAPSSIHPSTSSSSVLPRMSASSSSARPATPSLPPSSPSSALPSLPVSAAGPPSGPLSPVPSSVSSSPPSVAHVPPVVLSDSRPSTVISPPPSVSEFALPSPSQSPHPVTASPALSGRSADTSTPVMVQPALVSTVPSPLAAPSSISGVTSATPSARPSPPTEQTPSTFEFSDESPPSLAGPSSTGMSDRTPLPSVVAIESESTPLSTESSIAVSASSPPTSRSLPPVSIYASSTDGSYDSSVLRASPSLMSLDIQQPPDTSFGTSFLRPSSAVSSTIPTIPSRSSVSLSTSSLPEELPSLPTSGVTVETPSLPTSGATLSSPSAWSLGSSTPQPLSRTPSSVSSLRSSIFDSSSLVEIPEDIPDISTTPSLLPTAHASTPISIPPHLIPLPDSTLPSTPTSRSMSVSLSTPHGDTISTRSGLEAVSVISPQRSEILSHDINMLLQHLHGIDQSRGAENRELADHVRAIRSELGDLADWLRARDIPPPIPPKKDVGIDRISFASSERLVPRATEPIPLSPPPSAALAPGSPSSISSGMSFLSSHHSDEFSLLESETYPLPASPPWDSDSSSPSSSSSSPHSMTSTRSLEEQSTPTPAQIPRTPLFPVPLLPLPDTAHIPSEVPSPAASPVSSAGTVRARAGPSLADLGGLLGALRDQTQGLQNGQYDVNQKLDDLLGRRISPPDNAELNRKVDRLDDLLQRVIQQTQPRSGEFRDTYYSSEPEIEDIESIRRRWAHLMPQRGAQQPLQPTPVRPGPSINEMVADMLAAGPQATPGDVEQPPLITPLVHRPHVPDHRDSILELLHTPPRPHTVEPVGFTERDQPASRPPAPPGQRGPEAGMPQPRDQGAVSQDVLPADRRPRSTLPLPRPVIDRLYDEAASDRTSSAPPLRAGRGTRSPQRWYRPRPSTGAPGVPSAGLGAAPAAAPAPAIPQYMPMPPGPTVVEVPLFEALANILRENRLAAVATVDQQRELMRYMRGLNEWLERDVHDRQAELRGIYARVDQLRNELAHFGVPFGRPPDDGSPGSQAGEVRAGVVPPRPPPVVQIPGFPPNFQPTGIIPLQPLPPQMFPGGIPGGVIPGVIPSPESTSTTASYSPVIPSQPPVIWPHPQHFAGPPPGFPTPMPAQVASFTADPHAFVPPRPSSSSGSSTPDQIFIPSGPPPGVHPGPPVVVGHVPPPTILPSAPFPSAHDSDRDSDRSQHVHHHHHTAAPSHPSVMGDPARDPSLTRRGGAAASVPYTGADIPAQAPITINIPPSQSFPPPFLPQPGLGVPGAPPQTIVVRTGSPSSPSGSRSRSRLRLHRSSRSRSRSPTMPQVVVVPPTIERRRSADRDSRRRRSRSRSESTDRAGPTQVFLPPGGPAPVGFPQPYPTGFAPTPVPATVIHHPQTDVSHSPSARPPSIHIHTAPTQPGAPIVVPPGTQPTYAIAPSGLYPHTERPHSPSRSVRDHDPRHDRRPHSRERDPGYRRRSRSPTERDAGHARRPHSTERDAGHSRRPHSTEHDAGHARRPHSRDREPGYRRYSRDREPGYRRYSRDRDPGTRRYFGAREPGYRRYSRDRDGRHRRSRERDHHRTHSYSPSRRDRRHSRDRHHSPRPLRRRRGHGHPSDYSSSSSRSRRHSPDRHSHHPPRIVVTPGSAPHPSAIAFPTGLTPSHTGTPHTHVVTVPPASTHPYPSSPSAAPAFITPTPHPGAVSHRPPTVLPTPTEYEGDEPDVHRPHGRTPSHVPSTLHRPEFDERDAHRTPGRTPSHLPSALHRPESDERDAPDHPLGGTPSHVPSALHRPEFDERDADDVRLPVAPGEVGRDTHGRRPVAADDRLGVDRQPRRPVTAVPDFDERDAAEPHLERPASAPRRRATLHPEEEESLEARPHPSTIVRVPAPTHVPSDFDHEDEHERRARLADAEGQLSDVVQHAVEGEESRERHFRDSEGERDRIFAENEARRNAEAAQRTNAIWGEFERRLAEATSAHIPPRTEPPHAEEPAPDHIPDRAPHGDAVPDIQLALPEDPTAAIEAIRNAAYEAASQQHEDFLNLLQNMRDEMAAERERAQADRERLLEQEADERAIINEAREARIHALEEELAAVKAELEDERQQRITDEAERRERERTEMLERDEAVRNQLVDITNLLQDQREDCIRKREVSDERWAEQQARNERKDAQSQEVHDIVAKILDDREADRIRADEERLLAESKPGVDRVLEELARHNAEQRELLNSLADGWRADSNRQHAETIEAVRATAQEQVPFNVQGYLHEFSKALSDEVRMLLDEVGKLRDERRSLQYELGCLLTMRAKYAPGGEFDPDWKPPAPGPPPGPDGPPPAPPAEELPPAPKPGSGWRPITKGRKKKKQEAAPVPVPVPSVAVPPPDLRQQVAGSWPTWLPDPAYAPTPPSVSVEPTLLAPPQGSPGLFGPRSPRDSFIHG